MLLRICLILALIAALVAAVINFVMVSEKIKTVEQHRATEESAKKEAQTQLAKTTKELEKTAADLKQTKDDLATTTKERDAARNEAASQTKKAADLADKLATAVKERDEARNDLSAYTSTGFKPEQILNFGKQIAQLQNALDVSKTNYAKLDREYKKVKYDWEVITGKEPKPPPLPAGLIAKVLISDPKWDFVVLDVGTDQGVPENGEALVSRSGKLVAKVRIHSVQKDRCIANVIPGWKIGEIQEGDQVIPAS